MKVEIYPCDYEPYNIFADAPYDCTIHVNDRDTPSHIVIHTHKAGLEQLKEAIDEALEKLNRNKEMQK
jgi:hypothetical protein